MESIPGFGEYPWIADEGCRRMKQILHLNEVVLRRIRRGELRGERIQSRLRD
jgi:hypothetical protein